MNYLWIVLLGLAMVIAISCATWRKDERRRHAQEVFRQQVSEEAKARQVKWVIGQSAQGAAQSESLGSIRKIFGRPAQSYSLATDGRVDLGGVVQSGVSGQAIRSAKIEKYVDENGHVGYRNAVEN